MKEAIQQHNVTNSKQKGAQLYFRHTRKKIVSGNNKWYQLCQSTMNQNCPVEKVNHQQG